MRLAEVIDRYEPARVIALGDSLHDDGGAQRMAAEDLEILHMLQEGREWIWIAGNHDREIVAAARRRVVRRARDRRHRRCAISRRRAASTHEIAGHMHPAARLSMYGYSIRRPCFVGNGRRLVMPAFGAFAGGLNVLDEAFEPLFGNGGIAVWMLGQEGLYPVATRFLSAD